MLKLTGNEVSTFCIACRNVPLSIPADGDRNGTRFAAEHAAFAPYLRFSNVQRARRNTSFRRPPVPLDPRSNTLIDWILVLPSRAIGALRPPALPDQQRLPSAGHYPSPLTTRSRTPCYSCDEALASPLHNEAVKKRGADYNNSLN